MALPMGAHTSLEDQSLEDRIKLMPWCLWASLIRVLCVPVLNQHPLILHGTWGVYKLETQAPLEPSARLKASTVLMMEMPGWRASQTMEGVVTYRVKQRTYRCDAHTACKYATVIHSLHSIRAAFAQTILCRLSNGNSLKSARTEGAEAFCVCTHDPEAITI